jgi:hypothetical protein
LETLLNNGLIALTSSKPNLIPNLSNPADYAKLLFGVFDNIYNPQDVLVSKEGSWTQGFFDEILKKADYRFQKGTFAETLCYTGASYFRVLRRDERHQS